LEVGQTKRLYLLTNGSYVLAIEVIDVKSRGHLDRHSQLIEQFKLTAQQ
jgi:hypothetical protein